MSTGGEVANALVCKTSIRGFNSRPVLQSPASRYWLSRTFGAKHLETQRQKRLPYRFAALAQHRT
jgi:hypothetical protein